MTHENPEAHPPAPAPTPSAAGGAREEGGVMADNKGWRTPNPPTSGAGCVALGVIAEMVPPAPAPAPVVKDSLTTPTRSTERVALDLILGVHLQILDMLQDPDGASNDAWARCGELLADESIHAISTVLKARAARHQAATLRPLVTATIRPDETLAQYAARALGYPA